jgi:hypothetical protein
MPVQALANCEHFLRKRTERELPDCEKNSASYVQGRLAIMMNFCETSMPSP